MHRVFAAVEPASTQQGVQLANVEGNTKLARWSLELSGGSFRPPEAPIN